MCITVYTDNPQVLLDKIKKAIDDKHIDTWKYDKDGDFTHPTFSHQWEGAAWLKPHVAQGTLTFGLLGSPDVVMTKAIYGIYHGRFIEMLLTHFDKDFTTVTSTAIGNQFDNYKPAN